MRISVPCRQCGYNVWVSLLITGDGFYEATCENNHSIKLTLQEQPFELLFEVGVHAIKDEYYREAVSSFTASLERFYEFYVRLIAFKNGIIESEIEKAWKEIKNQSERQLGAFIFTYLNEKGIFPNVLDNNNVSFRNRVIHKGEFPTEEEALAYGQIVLDIINPILIDLKTNYTKELNDCVFRYLKNVRDKFKPTNSGLTIPTTISLATAVGYEITVKEALNRIKATPYPSSTTNRHQ